MAHPYPSEKKIFEDLLIMYKENTVCLWDPTHPGYTNKVSRRKALETLLVKFRELDPSADVYKMKKKIENMRTTYKRERLKVVRSRRGASVGGAGEAGYSPTLWYYPLLRFLDVLDPALDDDGPAGSDTNDHSQQNTDDDNSEHYAGSESPPHKKAKPSTVYITDEPHEYELHSPARVPKLRYSSDEEEPPYLIRSEGAGAPRRERTSPPPPEDLFGRAMSSRLNDLLPQQRYIAEKLISDVIFLGRLNKLKTGSTIHLNDDSY